MCLIFKLLQIFTLITSASSFDLEVSNGWLLPNTRSAEMLCSVESTSSNPVLNVTLRWSKNGNLLNSDSHIKISEPARLQSLIQLSAITEHDVGNIYKCEAYSPGESPALIIFKDVTLFATPRAHLKDITSSQKSVTVTDGKAMSIECDAWGYPPPSIIWERTDDKSIRASIKNNVTGYSSTSSELTWTEVNADDRATYNCNATNLLNTTNEYVNTAPIYLRVKGKLAPLWPLIGILIELVILAVIIGVYELNKRKKKRVEEQRLVSYDRRASGSGEPEAMVHSKAQ